MYSLKGANLTAASFTSDACRTIDTNSNTADGYEELEPGDWYATIENTDGELSSTNVITVTDTHLASVSDVFAQDDYETTNAGGITFNAADDTVVLSATLNKDYSGIFYVYEASETSYSTTKAKAKLDLTTAKVETTSGAGTAGKTAVQPYSKTSSMTAKNAVAQARANGTGAATAIKYVDKESGETTYMFVPETGADGALATAGLVRGREYVIVFDQEEVDTDNISPVARDDVEVSDEFEIPYLEAPAAIKVVDIVASGNAEKANVELYEDEEMTTPLSWLGDSTTGLTFANGVKAVDQSVTIKAFTNTKASTSDGKAMNAAAAILMKGGKLSAFSGTESAAGLSCLYATATFDAGIWGEKKIELTSGIAPVPAQSVGTLSTSYSKSAPNDIKVSFKGLKTAGTVYVVRTQRGSTNYTETDINSDVAGALGGSLTNVVGSADVARGTESVTVTDCVPRIFSTLAKKDAYSAIFVPENQDDFQVATTTVDTPGTNTKNDDDTYCVVGQEATKYSIGGDTTVTGKVLQASAADTDTGAVLLVEDQFGNDITTLAAAINGGSTPAATQLVYTANDSSSTKLATDFKVGVDTDGKIYTNGAYAACSKGDTYKFKITDGWYICFKVDTVGTNAGTNKWVISVTTS